MTRGRRKGEKDWKPLRLLLAEARPAWRDLEGNPDPSERAENLRLRDIATDELISMYHDAEKGGQVDQLDIQVRSFCHGLMARNGGKLPNRKGGRPGNQERRMLICLAAIEKVEALAGTQGKVDAALHDVAAEMGCSYELVRAAYYDRDPEWLLAVSASRAFRIPSQPADDSASDTPTGNRKRNPLLEILRPLTPVSVRRRHEATLQDDTRKVRK